MSEERIFCVRPDGLTIVVELSPEMSEAMDILSEYLVCSIAEIPKKWMKTLVTAEEMNEDPRRIARKLATLNQVLRKH